MACGPKKFELKFLTRAQRAESFVSEVSRYMKADPHGDSSGFYRVTSLYFDTPHLNFYYAKMDGSRLRRKLRLRVYPNGEPSSILRGRVEIKEKIGRAVRKKWVWLDLKQAEELCSGGVMPPEAPPSEEDTLSEISDTASLLRLHPCCVVSYLRRALVGSRFDPGLRVTIDSDLRARAHSLKVDVKSRNRSFLPSWASIVEIKAARRLPPWLVSLLASHEFCQGSVSKYCLGLERSKPLLKGEAASAGITRSLNGEK